MLTFDDGPWPNNTPAVLAALAAHCTKAIFFPIGLHATYEPGILKQVAAAGHAIGSHTWCHQDLSKTKGRCNVHGKVHTVEYNPKDEIEMGISAVHWAVGGPTAPYFRFPALRQKSQNYRVMILWIVRRVATYQDRGWTSVIGFRRIRVQGAFGQRSLGDVDTVEFLINLRFRAQQ